MISQLKQTTCPESEVYIKSVERDIQICMDWVFAVQARSPGFDCHWRHMLKLFFSDPIDQDIHTQLKISGIRVAVGDCSVTERRR